MRVAELMTKQVASCKPEDRLSAAAKLMWDADCGAVPVVGSDGNVKGMITDRDICMACYTRNQAPGTVSVQEAMSRKLYFCKTNSQVSEAEDIMRTNQVRRIPVVDQQGRLAGVLSLADIAREVERSRGKSSQEITADDVASILGGISRPQAAMRPH